MSAANPFPKHKSFWNQHTKNYVICTSIAAALVQVTTTLGHHIPYHNHSYRIFCASNVNSNNRIKLILFKKITPLYVLFEYWIRKKFQCNKFPRHYQIQQHLYIHNTFHNSLLSDLEHRSTSLVLFTMHNSDKLEFLAAFVFCVSSHIRFSIHSWY